MYKQALFIRFGGLGDILLATPSVRAVSRAFPGIEIDFIVGGGMSDVLADHPCLRNVITFDKRGIDSRIDRLLPFLVQIARTRYDLVINLHPSAKSYLMTAAAAPRAKVVFEKNSEVNQKTGRVTHAIDDFAKELRTIGIEELSDRGLDFTVHPDSLSRIAGLLGPEADRVLVINAAASRPVNRWSIDRFKAVAAHFASESGILVVLTGAPRSFHTVFDDIDEISLSQTIASMDRRILNLAGKLTVRELGALLSRSNVFLTCDTGPMHIGSAVRAPMVVLSGAANPDRTGPINPEAVVLIDRSLPCVPCGQRVCALGDIPCMRNLSTDRVIEEITALLSVRRVKEGVVAQSVGV